MENGASDFRVKKKREKFAADGRGRQKRAGLKLIVP
jgi:hypothetical protein